MSTILDMKQLMNILSKHAAKSLLLLILTSFLIACAEKEEEDEGKKTTLGDIARQYKSSKEFQDDPDMNQLRELLDENTETCLDLDSPPLAIKAIDSTDSLKKALGEISMAFCSQDLEFVSGLTNIDNIIASETISGSGTTTLGEGDTASTADFSYSGHINKPNSENVFEVALSQKGQTRGTVHWSGRIAGDTLTTINITVRFFDENTGVSAQIDQESAGKGVYRLLCNHISSTGKDATTSCVQYRYSDASGDFDANTMFDLTDNKIFSAYWGNLKKPQAAFLRMSPTTGLEQATFPTEVALPDFVLNQTAAYQYPVFKKVTEQLTVMSSANSTENFFQSAAGKEALKILYEVLDYQKKATDDKSMDSVYGMTTN